LRDPHHLAVVLDRFHLDSALLRHDAAWSAEGLALDPAWAPVYLDDVAVLLVRRIPEHQDLIRRFQIDLSRLRLPEARALMGPGGFSAERLENLGVFFLQVGRMDLARTLFQEAAAGPGQARAELFLGLEALDRGKLEEARSRLEAALPGSPANRPLIHARLAELAEREGAYDRAIIHWHKALGGEGNNCEWRERLGQALFKQGRAVEATQELEAALACPAPALVKAQRWGSLAVALAAENRLPEAEQAARAALKLDPNLQAARRLLEDLSRRQGKL
jgi:tetratricopeptide (TPR) repeat protein